MTEDLNFQNTFSYKLIYMFSINDKSHLGCIKIGEATVKGFSKDELTPNCDALNKAASNRIKQYTQTAGVNWHLLHTELAITNDGKVFGQSERKNADTVIREVLYNSGFEKKLFNSGANEWVVTDLETAKNAIVAVRENKKTLTGKQMSVGKTPIMFFPIQEDAIKGTIKQFGNGNKMLWNAKMRFGKTLCALEVVKRMEIQKTIIVSHRPVVDSGWHDDFTKIFYDTDYQYIKKGNKSIPKDEDANFVYFASIQDLRGSSAVNTKSNLNKNDEIFNIDWDLLIIDEAHEGTQTKLGNDVKILLQSPTTKTLELSGTPFNLLEKGDYDPKEIFTWDYAMEQYEKENWSKNHYLDSNPYADLPRMNIYTYDIAEAFTNSTYKSIEDKAFNFAEFFRVWTGDITRDKRNMPDPSYEGKFIHEDDIRKFLKLLWDENKDSNYPFSREEYRNYFKHTLWIIPSVDAGKALSKLLREDPVFQSFKIANVAGDGDITDEKKCKDALDLVEKTIRENPYSITLSCGKLTTGVTVKEWTAAFYLAGSYSTSASSYLQTIFRVQTPACIDGQVKDQCYVFDFAPDRTLTMIAEAGNLSKKAGAVRGTSDEEQMQMFLNFCPVISVQGSRMVKYQVDTMMKQLKKAYADRVFRSGFEHEKLYNDNLNTLDEDEKIILKYLKDIIGSTKRQETIDRLTMANNKLIEAQMSKPSIPPKPPTQKEIDQNKKDRQKWIATLRGISIRVPLLVYGVDIDFDKEITINNFTDFVDDKSWEEFMPRGVNKEVFQYFTKYYDKDIFEAAALRIRRMVRGADELPVEHRINELGNLFSTFRNPDKETVLTPWRVVNMHLGETIGGWNFFDENYTEIIAEPRRIMQTEITNELFVLNDKVLLLEINSKTGLYPLYMAYSKYREYKEQIIKRLTTEQDKETSLNLWSKVLADNVYVIAKTKMSASITQRTLAGFTGAKTNILPYENIMAELRNNASAVVDKITNPQAWGKKEFERMKFNAIVGNPPYQMMDNGENEGSKVARTSAVSIYGNFVTLAKQLSQSYVSLVIPSRWMTGGRGLDEFREENLKDTRYSVIHDYDNDQELFPNTDIGGGVMYFLWDKKHTGKLNYYKHNKDGIVKTLRFLDTGDNIIIRDYGSAEIIKHINAKVSFESMVSARKPFGASADITRENENLFTDERTGENDIKFYAWDGVPIVKYTKQDHLQNVKLIKSYKVFISKTADPPIRFGRENKDILRKPFMGEPMTACSETYLTIGCFDDKEQAEAVKKYVMTKFFRFLVLQKKKTQNVSRGVFEFVPMQDFSKESSIDWTKSMSEIDQQLYAKYNLSQEQIDAIENSVSAMK